MQEIALGSGKYVFRVEDTIKAMENGSVSKLYVGEELDVTNILN